MMKKTASLTFTLALATVLGACHHDYFNKDTYEQSIKYFFPVEDIDPLHDWKLAHDARLTVKATVGGTQRVLVLSENPYESEQSEILGQTKVREGQTCSLNLLLPNLQDSIFVAALDGSNRYLALQGLPADQVLADFTTGLLPTKGTVHVPREQSVVYCFEDCFPEPGDWDYNDVVLSASQQPGDEENQVKLAITLRAVGTTKQMAAAIRLFGVGYNDVTSITTPTGVNFVRNTELMRTIIKDEDMLLKGRGNEAVLNLFDDAHAAFYSRTTTTGTVSRVYYNTTNGSGGTNSFQPKTITYTITFNNADAARSFSLAQLDPFVLENYNGTIWEIHTFQYKFDEVLYPYYNGYQSSYNNRYSWAIEVPYQWFRYPVEGEAMGTYKNGAIVGAYYTMRHSFGEWMTDHTMATDWYLYPDQLYVY